MPDFIKKRSRLRDDILIVIGTLIMAVAINMIYDPMELVTGGVTGLGIIIKHLTGNLIEGGVPLWVTNLVFNIPIFIVSLKVFGYKYISKTLLATGTLTLFIAVVPVTPMFEADYVLSSLFGGIISGIGIGLVLLTMATTGGTDMLAMLVHHRRPYVSVPQLMLLIDGAIVLVGMIAFGITKALYAIIAVYVVTKVSDGMLDGLKFAKCAYIVSDRYNEIASEIMTVLDRGVTGLDGEGMYSHEGKKVLFCVVSRKEIVKVLEIVYKTDPFAFVTINDVREVWGEGYGEFGQSEQKPSE